MTIKEKKNSKIFKLIIIYLIIFLTIFIFLEHFSKKYLAKNYGYHIPSSLFLFKRNYISKYYNERGPGWKNTAILNTLDPILGYSHDNSVKKIFENFKDGYFLYEKKFQNSDTLKIAVFGGSTSDATTSIFNLC